MNADQETIHLRVIDSEAAEPASDNGLQAGLDLAPVSSREEKHCYYDTFERHAFRKGLLVTRKKGRLEITSLDTGFLLADVAFKGTPPSFFPESLPEGKARNLLLGCSDLRAFMRTCVVLTDVSSWRILDGNQKTIAILTSESMRLPGDGDSEPFARFHSITPLKGYHKELARMLRALPTPLDACRLSGFRDRALLVMESCSHGQPAYSSKLRIQLDPEATIHENVRRLLQFTTTIMRANEHGIIRDIDSEFLHDFRVALRRSRSIVRQLHGVFDPHRTAWLLTGFRDLGKLTNRLRDCDVYLLRKNRYPGYLPESLRPALERFFRELESERKPLRRELCDHLSGAGYRNFMQEVESFISDSELPDQELAPVSATPTRIVAAKSIRKAWKKVVAHGRRIGPETGDAELHELRIDCKKLRYLLEFFSSLFAARDAELIIGHLKELQENLGEFVDLSVQIEFLGQRISTLPADRDGIEEAAALGGLVAVLYRIKEQARKRFSETFSSFDDDRTRELIDDVTTSLQ